MSEKRYFTVDTHTHILPKTWPDLRERYGYGGFIRLEHHRPGFARMMMDSKFFREIEANCWDPEVRIEQLNGWNIDLQVVCTVPVMFSYWAKPEDAYDLSRILNDHIAEEVVDKYPDRFAGLATIPLQDTDLAIKELERCMKELGYAGIQIGSHVNDWNLDAPELFPVFEACQELGAAVMVHPWDMMGKSEMEKYWLPWLVGMPAETSRAVCSMIFGGVHERLPDLRVLYSHAGGSFPATIGRIQHGFDVRPDLCAIDNNVPPKNYLGKFYIDSITHDKRMLDYVIELVGSNRIALGSDYPFPLGELEPGELIKSTDYNDELKAQLLGNTAMEWLNLKKENYAYKQNWD